MLDPRDQEIEQLRAHIAILEAQIRGLGHDPHPPEQPVNTNKAVETQPAPETRPLKLGEYTRYGRQMILPGFGLPSQLSLRRSSVLVVGAGGLGCPALMYLASAGVGRLRGKPGKLTIVDHDTVELSNLHRQVLHGVDTIGKPKVESAQQALLRTNPSIEITIHHIPLTPYTLSEVFTPEASYDVILDCSDTPSTRYLLSDLTARLGIPLISGAAQRTDGQLVVYNLPTRLSQDSVKSDLSTVVPTHGPCMRCVFPSVSRTGAGAERCSDVGVLGPVVGVIGVLMALETIKILTGFGMDECETRTPSMLLYSALSPRPFKTIKLRTRQPSCRGCSGTPLNVASGKPTFSNILADIKPLEDDYIEFCGDLGGTSDPVSAGMFSGEPGIRANPLDLRSALASTPDTSTIPLTIIDTRSPTEFGICSIPESTNVPLIRLLKRPKDYLPSRPSRIFVVCRLGNDSQVAARALRDALLEKQDQGEHRSQVVDIVGGLRAWARDVDPSFPVY